MRGNSRTLTAFYDLSVSPTSFDFATFMALAERHRVKSGCDSMTVLVVPAVGGFWNRENIMVEEQVRRVERLLLPLSSLWPSCTGIATLKERGTVGEAFRAAEPHVFPAAYRPQAPLGEVYQWARIVAACACGETIPDWEAPAGALATVDRWLADRRQGRKLITVTLREANYHTAQNSDLAAWGDFARKLDPQIYFPVFVRDTEQASAPSPEAIAGFQTFPEASFDVTVRAALYARSYLCLMSPSGPMMLLWLNAACRSIVFSLHRPGLFRNTPMTIRAMGLEIGRPLPVSGPFHRIVWEPDAKGVILPAFNDMVALIESGRARALATRATDPPSRIARRLRKSGREAAAREVYSHLRQNGRDRLTIESAEAGLAMTNMAEGANSTREILPPRIPRMIGGDHDLDMMLDLSDWCVCLGEVSRAEKICSAILARHPDHAEALCTAGDIDLRMGYLDKATSRLGRSAQLYPWSAVTRYEYGVALVLQGREREACDEFYAASLNDPSHEAARLRLSELDCGHKLAPDFTYEDALARRGGDRDIVIGELEFAVPLSKKPPDGCDIYYYCGRFHAFSYTRRRYGQRPFVEWRKFEPYYLTGPRRGLTLAIRIIDAAARIWPQLTVLRRTRAYLVRGEKVVDARSVRRLSELDIKILMPAAR